MTNNGFNHGNGGAPGAAQFMAVGGVATAVVLPLLYVLAFVYVRLWKITIPMTAAYAVWHFYGGTIYSLWDATMRGAFHILVSYENFLKAHFTREQGEPIMYTTLGLGALLVAWMVWRVLIKAFANPRA